MMEGDNYEYDAPNFIDFASSSGVEFELPSDRWFVQDKMPHRVAKEPDLDAGDRLSDDWSEPSSSTCPSPTKKQRFADKDEDLSTLPRRSPRFVAAAHQKHTHVMSTGSLINKKIKSTEEIELEEIARRREEFAKSRKIHEITYKKTKLQGKISKKAAQPPTIPKEFHFHSDQRIKGLPEGTEETFVQDFARTLRKAQPSVEASRCGNKSRPVTQPKPFNLTSPRSVSSLTSMKKFTSTAEQINNFSTNYFRSSSRTKEETNHVKETPDLTVPKTPSLSTRGRSRSLKVLTRAEEEEQEYEEHKKQQFKAHPVNNKILKEAQLGVPKVPSKPPTTVKEFNLHKTSGHPQRLLKDQREEEMAEFHAHPVNRKILEGPVGVKPAEKRPITIPESPAFALRGRLRSRERVKSQEEAPPAPAPAPKVTSKPVLHAGVPFRPQLEHKCTIPKPFAVEDHSKEMLKKKEEKIKQVLEEERKAREFTASLLPSDSPDQLPARKTRPVTTVEPFNLSADDRGKKYNDEWKAKIQAEEDEARSKAQFHASSNSVIFKAPFVPEKPTRPLTEMSSFTLNTDRRAVERETFNQQCKAHEAAIEAIKIQREERKEKEKNQEVAQLRQNMVHKATGVKKYKSVAVLPSDKPLTEPQSPMLRTRSKCSLVQP